MPLQLCTVLLTEGSVMDVAVHAGLPCQVSTRAHHMLMLTEQM